MKKKFVLLVSSLLTVGALTGCGGKNDGKTHIQFWHTMGQANQVMLDRMIESFQEANPDIVVEAFSQGGYDDIAGKIRDAIPAGTTPTLSFCYPDNVATYIEAGAVEELTPYIQNEEYGLTQEELKDFNSDYWSEGTNYQQPGVFSVPYAKSTEVLFYNASVFEAYHYTVPTTWDEMWTLCATMKAELGSRIKTPLGYDSDSNLFITKCVQENIPYTSKDATTKADYYQFNNAQAKTMVSELKLKYDAGLFITKGTQPNSTYTSTAFTNQQIIMSIGSTGGTTYNKSLNFDIGVAPLPRGSVNGKVVSQGPSICIFSRATAAEKVAAWKFYKHITSPDNTATFAINTGYEPVRNSARETPQFKTYLSRAGENYITKRGGDLLASAAALTRDAYAGNYFSSDVFPGSDTARDEVGGIISNVFLNTKSIDQAFTDALTNCLYVG